MDSCDLVSQNSHGSKRKQTFILIQNPIFNKIAVNSQIKLRWKNTKSHNATYQAAFNGSLRSFYQHRLLRAAFMVTRQMISNYQPASIGTSLNLINMKFIIMYGINEISKTLSNAFIKTPYPTNKALAGAGIGLLPKEI